MLTPFLLNETSWFGVVILLLILPFYIGLLAMLILTRSFTGLFIGLTAAGILALIGVVSLLNSTSQDHNGTPFIFFLLPLLIGLFKLVFRSKKPPVA